MKRAWVYCIYTQDVMADAGAVLASSEDEAVIAARGMRGISKESSPGTRVSVFPLPDPTKEETE